MLDVTRLRVLAAVARHGSVTAAAQALHYGQPSVSHHLARLEAETGAVLTQRVGRGIRLTEAGRRLAERAEEILGRLDAAEAELAELSGLHSGRVRMAAFPSAAGTFVPQAMASFRQRHPGIELTLVAAEPPEALQLLRGGEVEIAVAFDHRPIDEPDLRLTPVLTEKIFLVTPVDDTGSELTAYADAEWIAGCERCRQHLVRECTRTGFAPRIAYTTDDYVAVQNLVAAGLGVATLPELALRAVRHPGVRVCELPGQRRQVFAAVYGQPPDPPATTAALQALAAVG
ncbi:LysR family transcriptional regulator [Fodinicola acaciae]|uniref:LysR family transcriptional regulator n=1 Tax=Fodinicola acaciae TaxID=2681555 RepID=UPI0013D756AF|nr:LysR family transcriptional regulator [Fodinicola acaciae]